MRLIVAKYHEREYSTPIVHLGNQTEVSDSERISFIYGNTHFNMSTGTTNCGKNLSKKYSQTTKK